jgi:hypothetical protein
MGDGRHPAAGYLSRLVSGLVACAVVAVTLRAHVATAAILGAVMLLAIAMSWLIHRDGA